MRCPPGLSPGGWLVGRVSQREPAQWTCQTVPPTVRDWDIGAKVRHTACPEWGVGVVTAAQSLVHEGVRCQRLTVRFDKVGSKTISTAFANLAPATDTTFDRGGFDRSSIRNSPEGTMPATPATDELLKLESKAATEETFLKIPEPANDPFVSLTKRATATLDLYRFSPQGASLLDWAMMQSGLRDPLSRFNRHELETLFSRFRQNLDTHARKTLKELKKQDPAALAAVLAAARPEAKAALRRIDIDR